METTKGEEGTQNMAITCLEMFRGMEELRNRRGWEADLVRMAEETRMLDLAVMCQADLPTIEYLCGLYPDQLTEKSLCLACRYGSRAGVVSFLAKKKPELVQKKWTQGHGYHTPVYPISLLMTYKSSEDDIKCLLELWPESVITSMEFVNLGRLGAYSSSMPLQVCLENGYSQELLHFMLSLLPTTIPEFCIHNALGLSWQTRKAQDMEWIRAIVPKIKGDLFSHARAWEETAFLDMLQELFTNGQSAELLRIDLPWTFDDSHGRAVDQCHPTALLTLNGLSSKAKQLTNLKELDLYFVKIQNTHLGTYLELLNCLEHLPSLETLTISRNHKQDIPLTTVGRILDLGKLECLNIWTFDLYGTGTINQKKRKRSNPSSHLTLLPHLRNNTSLQKLEIIGFASSEEYSAFSQALLEILQFNVTIQDVTLTPVAGVREESKSDTMIRITYLALLNAFDRGRARDPTVNLCDFILCLAAVVPEELVPDEDDDDNGGGDDDDEDDDTLVTSIQYSLLLEAVSKWTVCAMPKE